MKISFGSEIVTGPWGGGNLFLINLKNYLTSNGHQVVFGLDDKDVDIILFTDPRTGRGSTSLISSKDVKKYKRYINKYVKVIQRINECDERKNTKKINKLYLKSSEVADHVVFVSEWLRKIYLDLGMEKEKTSVIMSGSDTLIFNSIGATKKPVNRKFKVLTHHWSSNWMKGFELYLQLDKKLSEPTLKNKIEFTYIGNVDKKYEFSNTNILQPLSGLELAEEIKNHDIYITGSLNEPSGNHHIEAALCGLPILYFNSGGIPEYCQGYGLEIDMENFEEKILYMIDYFDIFKNKMKNYPFKSENMSKNYLNLFNNLRN
jgi:glycosyltransferase involved in cell wall biosynthesis